MLISRCPGVVVRRIDRGDKLLVTVAEPTELVNRPVDLPERKASGPDKAGRHWDLGTVFAGALIGTAILMRLNNAVRYPSLHGYDSYAHVTYMWDLIKTGTVPLPSDGWGRFHPPLYYVLCAGIWRLLHAVEPKQVLKVINIVFSLAGLGSALVSYVLARRYFARHRFVPLLAPAFILFLPVSIYTAPMFGNESLNMLLCSLAVYFLIRTMQTRGFGPAVVLGLILGLALLTKFTAVVCAAGAAVALGFWGLYTKRWRAAFALSCVVATMAVGIAGWFYLRNVHLYGTPFQMSREYSVTSRIEQSQATGKRGIAAYMTFDPRIFKEPTSLSGPAVDSVWTGLFLNTWFDSFQNWFLPYNHSTKAVARILLALGVIPTLLVLCGLCSGFRLLLRCGWEDTLVVMLAMTGLMVAAFAAYTYDNRIASAVKASYILPAIVPLSFWFALGVHSVRTWGRQWLAIVVLDLLLLLMVIVPVYSYQVLFEVDLGPHYWNTVGVVDYFAGFRDQAYKTFRSIARDPGLYLAHENVASIALEEGRTGEALSEIQQAIRLSADQAIGGTPAGTAELLRNTLADYQNTLAVIYDQLGQGDLALQSAQRAAGLDPALPEASYNLGVLLMKRGLPDRAVTHLRRATALDPGFAAAFLLLGAAQEQAGNCKAAVTILTRALAVRQWPRRTYPHATGTGDIHDAAIVRRRRITRLPAGADPYRALAACQASADVTPTHSGSSSNR